MEPSSPDYAIHSAAREGQTSAIETLIKSKPRLASKRDDDGRLPIHWAVAHHHRDIVDILTASENFDPDVQDDSGWTPLAIASSTPDGEELVDVLLRKGANPNLTTHAGQTPLHFTVSKSNIRSARKLIENQASARVRDKRGQLPLHRAAAVGSVILIQLLLNNGSPVNTPDLGGQTALHHAISEGHGEAALILVGAGADTQARDADGNLAIELAPDSKVRNFIIQRMKAEGLGE